jgi:hypothetical protein
MNLVPEAIGRMIARQSLATQAHAPTILFGAGVVGVVGSTVLACRATLKLEDVLEQAQRDLNIAKRLEDDDYSEKDRQKDISLIYVQNAVKVARLYAPAVILGTASIAALTRSHNMLSQRNAALTAAYAALEKGFSDYRKRVVEKYGEEEDREFRYGTEIVEIVDPETKKKTTIKRVGPEGASIYARFFDQFSPSWSKEPEYNLIFLKCQQNYANDLLRSRGHVFLNEVYDMLGIERSQAGAVIGWILSRHGDTDNYVNFGIFDDNDAAIDFVNGREGSILLDFNVDGVIFDKIDRNREELSWQKGS